MSFKREGDDTSQLNVLKKRRVADLLSNFIPEDEAALLKNGRYTCLVCSYRPVFDTVDMLTVHRSGKRHLEGMKWYYSKKRDLKNDIEKRRHRDYVRAEEEGREEVAGPAPLLAQTRKITHHALLKSTPYNSCHRKSRSREDTDTNGLPTDGKGAPGNPNPPAWAERTASVGASAVTSLPGHNSTAALECTRAQFPARKQEKKKSQPTEPSEPEPGAAQRHREMEHYLKLKSSGWIQDRAGNWVKDEDVEFDSDEDQPPALCQS
ncbi:sodium channel modifier 1 [Amia ocellicauda]|uniref:sodium channel modifier 1 n=1 Tax=Amia ocellicauda TaxID=2972642 RepID=UPI0034641D25